MRPRLFIVENFYSDPHAVRKVALRSDFAVEGNYPGLRTRPALELWIREAIQEVVGEPITNWPLERDNGSFQYALCGHRTAVHADPGWVGLIYLTPNPAPRSGTLFYRHISTNLMNAPADSELRISCERDGCDPSKWEKLDTIGNVFNRLVLFEGRRWHSADEFFGESLETSRLFQTFFFWTSSSFDW
jgi:hypothetical protein